MGTPLFYNSQQVEKYKPLFIFVFKVVLLLLFFGFLKFIHRSLVESSSCFPISTYLRGIDIYALGADSLIYPAKVIFNIFNIEHTSSGRFLFVEGGGGVEIQAPCLGFNIFAVFISLIVSYPVQVSFIKKALFIIGGILLIHFLNVIRICAVALNNDLIYSLPIDHHDLYNFLIYLFVLLLFYYWITNNSSTLRKLEIRKP